jgi:hypothetical protein
MYDVATTAACEYYGIVLDSKIDQQNLNFLLPILISW